MNATERWEDVISWSFVPLVGLLWAVALIPYAIVVLIRRAVLPRQAFRGWS
jgi:hypothetical protein